MLSLFKVPPLALPVWGRVAGMIGLLVVSPVSHAVKDKHLWLPKEQEALMPRLRSAAELAEGSEDCLEVASGELDTQNSTPESIIFRIVCRNSEGLTYAMRTRPNDDGKHGFDRATKALRSYGAPTKETLETVVGADVAKKAAQLSTAAVVGKTKGGLEGWRVCAATIDQRLDRMVKPVVQRKPAPVARLDDKKRMVYVVDFDAADPIGRTLYFVAVCTVLPTGKTELQVQPRPVEGSEGIADRYPVAPDGYNFGAVASGILPREHGIGEVRGTPPESSAPPGGGKSGSEAPHGASGKTLPASGQAAGQTTSDGWIME